MADTPKVYAICDANCRWETLTREQIITAITQAVNEGTISDIDTGFVQTIKTINGAALKFFVGEQSEYDALSEEAKQGLFAIITNDTTKESLFNYLETLANAVESVNKRLNSTNGDIDKIVSGNINVGTADASVKAYLYPESEDKDYKVIFAPKSANLVERLRRGDMSYNPSTDTLTVSNVNGKATSAAEADHATETEALALADGARASVRNGEVANMPTLELNGIYLVVLQAQYMAGIYCNHPLGGGETFIGTYRFVASYDSVVGRVRGYFYGRNDEKETANINDTVYFRYIGELNGDVL